MSAQLSLWPQPVRLVEVAQSGLRRTLAADEAARARIAKAFELVSLDMLEAELSATPWFDGVQIEGRWRARVVQTCGVSLEDFASDLGGAFRVRLAPQGSDLLPDPEAEIPLDLEADVIRWHEKVFGQVDYEISPDAKEISDHIKNSLLPEDRRGLMDDGENYDESEDGGDSYDDYDESEDYDEGY